MLKPSVKMKFKDVKKGFNVTEFSRSNFESEWFTLKCIGRELSGSSYWNGSRKVNHRFKTCQPGRQKTYYFTTGRRVTEESIRAMKADIFKPYQPPELKSLEEAKKFWKSQKEKKTQEEKSHYSKHHNHSSRLKLLWKSERLFVPDDFILPGNSVTEDIDPNFFTMVSGRPIKEKTDTRKYLRDVRNCFETRLKTGFYLDEILLANERHLNEKKRLTKIRGSFLSCLKGFETFLEEDHVSSSTLLKRAKEETEKSKSKLEMKEALKEELKKLSAVVLSVEEEWRNLKMYQKFLFLISPPEWRKVNDPYYGEEDQRIRRTDPCLFDSFRDIPGDEETDLDTRISKFKEDVREGQPLNLYFDNPREVLNILAELEKNNMRALVYSKELDFPAEKMMAELEKTKIRLEQDQMILEEEIKYLEGLIEEEEKNAKSNEAKLRDIAFGLFRDLITNEEHLTMMALVEDAYEDAVAPNDNDLDLISMIKEIELKHESLLLSLDCLPNDIMIRSTRQFYREQKREMKEAKEAEKKVHQMEMLLKRLSKVLAPPKKFVPRRIVPRSLPPEERMFKFEPPKILSKEEKGHLFFFGEAPENVRLYKPLCL